MGNTCIPVVDSFWYLAKLIQFVKFKNKIKLKKKELYRQGKKKKTNGCVLIIFEGMNLAKDLDINIY